MSKTCVIQQEMESRTEMELTNAKLLLTSEPSDAGFTNHFTSVWPFVPKYSSSKQEQTENRNASVPPSILLRTSSLNRIRQFPAYLCRRGSNSVLFWLYNSRSVFREALSSAHKQTRGLFLGLCVYLAIGLIVAQLAVCGLVLSIAAPTLPNGFVFMVTCIVIMGAIGMKTINHDKEMLQRDMLHS